LEQSVPTGCPLSGAAVHIIVTFCPLSKASALQQRPVHYFDENE